MATGNSRYIEDAEISFAMYCDTQGLTHEQGTDLAQELFDALIYVADDRQGAVPGEVEA